MNQLPQSIKILPLGDSITEGYDIPGGYRIELWQKLASRGYKFEFVGSLADGPDSLPNRNHEGHSGWRIDQIHLRVMGWLNQFQPDIILLMIGTNDIVQSFSPDVAAKRLENLIQDIFKQLPHVSLLAASIPPINHPTFHQNAVAYNIEISRIVQEKQRQGYHTKFVDIYPALTIDDLPDGTHPNHQGYSKIAAAWDESLVSILSGNGEWGMGNGEWGIREQ